MFLWLNFLLSCVISIGFKPMIYNDTRNTTFSTDTSESLNCSETKVRDNYMSTGDNLFLMNNDFRSIQFANVLFSNIDILGTQFNNFPSDIPYPTEINDVITVIYGDAVNGSVFGYLRRVNSDRSGIGLSGYPVTAFSIQKYFVNELETGQRLLYYDLTLIGRDGAGNFVNYITYMYRFWCPYYFYSSNVSDVPTSLGNVCYMTSQMYPSDVINANNYDDYVYQEYIGDGYPSPFYNAYYLGINSDISIEQANQQGYERGFTEGRVSGYREGQQVGYSEGIEYAQSQDTTALTIFTGIIDIGLLPVNVFLKIFEFEVFGINVAGALSALLTIAITFIILRFVTGKKND